MNDGNNGNNLTVFCDYSAFLILIYVVIFMIKVIQRIYFWSNFLLFC